MDYYVVLQLNIRVFISKASAMKTVVTFSMHCCDEFWCLHICVGLIVLCLCPT